MRMLIGRSCVLACVALAFGGPAGAGGVELDKIVVTASRIEEASGNTARNMDVISAEEIETMQAKDVAQVLNELTSVNISDYGGIGATKTIRMRGSSAAQVLVMVDGRPINSPRDGETDLTCIGLDSIDRIEVMHGPGSSLYGSGAMGGVVNIITRRPPIVENQKTEISSSYGSARTYTGRFSHGARISGLGYIITGEYLDSAGFRSNSDYRAKDLNSKLEYELGAGSRLSLNTGFYKSRLGAPGRIIDQDIDDRQNNSKNFLDLSWDTQADETTSVSARVYQNYDRLEFIENTAGSIFDTAGSRDFHTTIVRGADIRLSRQISPYYRGTCGLNYADNLNDSTTSAKHSYFVRAAYLENKFDLYEKLKINLGARADDYSNFGTRVNPSLSFLYPVTKKLKLRGSASRSFRAPTFNDLYWPDQGWARGNPGLNPEKGITKEIGIDAGFSQAFSLGITGYRSDYRGLINWQDDAGVWMPKNVGSAVIKGIELENRLNFSPDWSFIFGYTFSRAKDKQTRKYLIYQPKHKADFSVVYKGVDGLRCELKGQFTGRRFYDADNSSYVKSFFVLDLNVSRIIRPGLTGFVCVDNLFSRRYQVMKDYPMPGFALTGGMKAEF